MPLNHKKFLVEVRCEEMRQITSVIVMILPLESEHHRKTEGKS